MRNGWLPLAACLCASLLLMGCGTCPDLSYRGRVKQEDVSYIRNCVAGKNIDLANVRWYERNLALHMVLVPCYFGVEKVVIFDGLENVTTGEKTGGRRLEGDRAPARQLLRVAPLRDASRCMK